jgi:hypothetical protein
MYIQTLSQFKLNELRAYQEGDGRLYKDGENQYE